MDKRKSELSSSSISSTLPIVSTSTPTNISSSSSSDSITSPSSVATGSALASPTTSTPLQLSDDFDDPVASIIYVPSGTMPKLSKYLGKLVDIRIASKFISLNNYHVQNRTLWGTDIYTDDSDVVAILKHSGRFLFRSTPPVGMVGVSVIFRVLPARSDYEKSCRNSLTSRSWKGQYPRSSIQFVRVEPIESITAFQTVAKPKKTDGKDIKALKKDREQKLLRMTQPPEKFASHASAIAPTPVPAAASNAAALRAARAKRKFAPFCTFMTSTNGDLFQKYEVPLFFDNGITTNEYTAQKFRKFTAYFQTLDNVTYELTREEEIDQPSKKKTTGSSSSSSSSTSFSSLSSSSSSSSSSSTQASTPTYDVYRWSIVKEVEEYNPLVFFAERKKRSENEEEKSEEKNKRQRLGFSQTPLPSSSLETLHSNVDWENVEWGTNYVRINGTKYSIYKVSFRLNSSSQ